MKIFKSFEELKSDKLGTIYVDENIDVMSFVIMRGPMSLCAYIGFPPCFMTNFDYDNIPLPCHGGLTYKQDHLPKHDPDGLTYIGWDYAHLNDKLLTDNPYLKELSGDEWTVEMVYNDSKEAINRMIEFYYNVLPPAIFLRTI